MDFQFECHCGEEISDFVRSDSAEVSFRMQCDGCGEGYVVTITSLDLEEPARPGA